MKNTKTKLLAITLGVAFSIPAVSIAATNPAANNSNPVTVSYADLNLSNEKGVETLYQRIKLGARKSCGSVSARELSQSRINRKCIEKAIAEAVNSIGNEKLKQLHSS